MENNLVGKLTFECLVGKDANFLWTETMTKEIVKEEVVEFVWTHKVFGLLLYFSIFVCRDKFWTDWCVDDVVERLGRSFVELVGNSEYEMLDESLWHTCINTIHRHVVAIVSSPTQSKFREVASTNNHTTKLIAEVHKNLRTLTSLRILVGNIMNIRIVTNILEMLHYTLGNRNLIGCYSKRIHKVYSIIVSTVGSAEAWHRDTDDTLAR